MAAAAPSATMGRFPDGFDVGGVIRAEVFVIWLNGADIELTGPAGPAPWVIELEATDHPVDVVDRFVRERIGPPLMVHSTSWRHDGDALILSFVVVIDRERAAPMASAPIPRAELARSEARAAPARSPLSR